MRKASKPFVFSTEVHLQELTGIKARTLKELLAHIQTVPGAVIYHHTHHFLQQHQYLSPEPPNDFAYWVSEVLNERELGEKLASINTCEFPTIRALREKIARTVEDFIAEAKRPLKEAGEGEELHFVKSQSFVMVTPYSASTLEEFTAVFKRITIDSLYFHMFEARLRLERGVNDFSLWMEKELGEGDLAQRIARLDPYTHTMEKLREKILRMMEVRLAQSAAPENPDAG